MKRFLSLLLVIVMLFSMTAVATPAGAESKVTHGYLFGDVDDDREFSMKDLLALRKYLLGIYVEKDINKISSDVDENGDVSMTDLLNLRKMLLGLYVVGENNSDGKYKVNTVTLGGRNINRYTIVYPTGNECMEYSAEILAEYVNKACGVTLNRTTKEAGVTGYKIKFSFDTENNFDLGKEGYRVHLDENGDLQIYCGSKRGSAYAAYYILEELVGWRFIASDLAPLTAWAQRGSIQYLYEADNVNLPEGYDQTEVPVVDYRAIAMYGVTYENALPLRENYNIPFKDNELGPKYGWGEGITVKFHAHSYEYQCGIGYFEQPCLTDEETYNKIMDYTHNLIAERAKEGQIMGRNWNQMSISPNDNSNYCTCGTCKAVYAVDGISGAIFQLSNRCARELDKFYPGIEIYTLSYAGGGGVPKMTRPEENVVVCYCFSYQCNNHPLSRADQCLECGGNKRLESIVEFADGSTTRVNNEQATSEFKAWAALTDNLYIWYYVNMNPFKGIGSPNIMNAYEDIKYLADNGAKGMYFEGSGGCWASFEMLKSHLYAKMMWNPFMSEEEFNEILNEFLFIYYGDGWEEMRRVISMLDHAGDLQGCWTNNFDNPWNEYNQDYIRDNYLTIAALLDSAAAKVTTDHQRRAVRYTRVHVDFLGLSATYERDYVNGDEDARALYEERYANLYNSVNEAVDIYRTDGFGNEGYYKGCKNFPTGPNHIIKPMEWIFVDYSGEIE